MDNILKIIADNPALFEALKKLLGKQFEITDSELEKNMSDELLGQMTRANIVGKNAINNAFREINQYKTISDTPEIKNPAR